MEIKEEQPLTPECNSIENNSNTENSDISCEGSSIGKFQNADELFKAYVNLEKEFTKKCQKLKELEIAKDNENKAPAKADNAQSSPNANNELVSKQMSIKEMLVTPIKNSGNDTASQQYGVIDTASQNGYTNETVSQGAPRAIITEDVKNAILQDVEIRNKFIENYLNEIQSQNVAPLMINNSSSNFCVMPKQKPENIKAAGEVAKDMFNN